MNQSTLVPHAHYEVIGFQGNKEVIDRLIEFGFHPGAHIQYQGRALFGGPLILKTHNMIIALRPEEVSHLELKMITEQQ